ncbi:hypothetical protein [uncultured Desulfobulbus sp.]|uniref:hypothetical protein n=1 Tax=uncultured Desulfobulbus sp. TaxID=239745 RepID=UPI0029C60B82|nr:hypothetical protein [uncultured Desulfobulbus sp.]
MHGTGKLTTWFQRATHRPSRDRISLMVLKSQRIEISFTVEDGARVEALFKTLGLLHLV